VPRWCAFAAGASCARGERQVGTSCESLGSTAHEVYDVTDNNSSDSSDNRRRCLSGTHKSWWNAIRESPIWSRTNPPKGGKGNHLKIYDLSDPAKRCTSGTSGCSVSSPVPRHSRASGRYSNPWADLGWGREEPRLRGLRHGRRRCHSDSRPEEIADLPSPTPSSRRRKKCSRRRWDTSSCRPTRVRTPRCRCMACRFPDSRAIRY